MRNCQKIIDPPQTSITIERRVAPIFDRLILIEASLILIVMKDDKDKCIYVSIYFHKSDFFFVCINTLRLGSVFRILDKIKSISAGQR